MGEKKARGMFPPVEFRRKVFHVMLGTAFMLLIVNAPWALAPLIVLFIAGSILSLVQNKRQLPVVTAILARFDREGDRLPGMGIITFFAGVLIVWTFFPRDIALAGCAAMTFGDPMASVIGMAAGRHGLPWNRSKSIEGSAAFIITTFAFMAPMYGPLQAIIIALSGAVFESIGYPKGSFISDNTIIPSGTALPLFAFRMMPYL
ncbi:MAG: hypothetical protein QCI82_00480 [Candidatus Thermoplasmatota archaeon]|nr:hypothetical protein [Candidatus Thermoplasmatota archaeon]